jgi:hypothetical protein
LVYFKETEAIALGSFPASIEAYIRTAYGFLGTLIDDFSGDAAILLGL